MLRTLVMVLALGGAAYAQDRQNIKSDDVVQSLETSYERVCEKVGPAVVAIKVDREAEPKAPAPAGPRRFGMPEDVFAKRPAAWCSGLIVESTGTILTTYFNVSGKVRSIKVQLPDGRELDAELLGFNATYDLAALKIEADGLPTLKKGRLEDLKVGQPLVALGRAPNGKSLTVNPGIVSAPSRLAGKGIQIDSKLNYGNVGGPVVDLDGRLLAVSCKIDVKYAPVYGQNSGVGFAITHDRFSNILADPEGGQERGRGTAPVPGHPVRPEEHQGGRGARERPGRRRRREGGGQGARRDRRVRRPQDHGLRRPARVDPAQGARRQGEAEGDAGRGRDGIRVHAGLGPRRIACARWRSCCP